MNTDTVVVGAGIAGLVAAISAAEQGASVVVLEAHQPGGRARTTIRDGWSLNVGPHALFRGGHLAAFLAARGVHPPGGVVATTSIGVVLGDRVHEVSMTPMGVMRIPVLGRRSRLRLASMFARLNRMDTGALVGRSVDDWLGGEPDDVRAFLQIFLRLATYVDAPARFDAGAAAEQLRLSTAGVVYLHGGWGTLVGHLRSLAESIGVKMIDHQTVTSITVDRGRERAVVHCGDDSVSATSVVVAAGGPATAERLTGTTVRHRAGLTEPIMASCLDLGVRRSLARPAFAMDRALYVSPHAPLADLAPEGHGLISAIRYLAPGETPASPAVEYALLRDFSRIAGVADDDVMMERALHRVVVSHGAPTAAGGGLAGRPPIDALGIPCVYLAGDWVGAHGLLADASATSGEQAGQAAAAFARANIAA